MWSRLRNLRSYVLLLVLQYFDFYVNGNTLGWEASKCVYKAKFVYKADMFVFKQGAAILFPPEVASAYFRKMLLSLLP